MSHTRFEHLANDELARLLSVADLTRMDAGLVAEACTRLVAMSRIEPDFRTTDCYVTDHKLDASNQSTKAKVFPMHAKYPMKVPSP